MFDEITSEKFNHVILNNETPSVVEIFTNNCPNCKTLDPIFNKTSNENGDRFKFYKLNAQENIDIAKRYKVLAVPALLFFSHGKLVDRKIGVIDQDKIEKKLNLILKYTAEIAVKKEITGYFKMPWK